MSVRSAHSITNSIHNSAKGRVSAGSIRIDESSRLEKEVTVNEYECETVPEQVTNPLGHFKGFCRMPSWLVFLIANVVLLISVLSIGVVLGLTLTKTASGGSCTKDADCDSVSGLICSAGTCQCPTTKYWDTAQDECTSKKKLNTTCSSAKECDDRIILTCVDPTTNSANSTIIGTGICGCATGLYWNGTQCVLMSSSSGSCYPNLAFTGCDSALGLYCSNVSKTCVCDTTKKFWSGSVCIDYKTYLEPCPVSVACSPGTSLYCESQGTNAGLCVCASKFYWNGSKCTAVLTYSTSCAYTQQCDTSLSLFCATSGTLANKCDCPANMYWTGSTCASKLSVGGICTSNSTCDSTVLLYCIGGTCQCASTHYWEPTSFSCLPKKVVAGSCGSALTCDASANLICSGSGGAVGSCACPTTSFWNGTSCQLKLLWKVSCQSSVQCNDFKSLVCTNTSEWSPGNFICDCSSYTLYFDGTTCASKKPNLSPCGSTYECQSYNLLSCNASKCICPETHYWDVYNCTQKRMYTVPCLSDSQCDNFRLLTCPTTIGGCNCPFTSTGYFCDCSTTSFWNATSAVCQSRGSYGSSCPLGNYQCLTANTGLSCISSVCDCPPKTSNWFWNSAKCKQCPNGWSVKGIYCYYETPFSTDWNTARQYCKTFGGYLATINDQTEFDSFQANAKPYVPNSGDISFIGVNSQTVANSWFWENSASLSTSSAWWCSTPSSDACAAIYNNAGTLCIKSVPCTNSYQSICEVS